MPLQQSYNMYILEKNIVGLGDVSQYSETNGSIYIFEPVNAQRKYSVPDYRIIMSPSLINPWTFWDANTKLASIRLQRDYLLSKSDWIVSKYAETLTEVPQNWRDYRQALRDFPSTVDVNLPIEQIVWPVSP